MQQHHLSSRFGTSAFLGTLGGTFVPKPRDLQSIPQQEGGLPWNRPSSLVGNKARAARARCRRQEAVEQRIYGCRQSIHLPEPYKESRAITYKQRCLLMGISSDLEIYVPLPAGLPSLCQPGQGAAESRGRASRQLEITARGCSGLLRGSSSLAELAAEGDG